MDKAKEIRINIRKTEEKIQTILNEFIKENGSYLIDIEISQTYIEQKCDPENKGVMTDVCMNVKI